jgi:hypothetical protein
MRKGEPFVRRIVAAGSFPGDITLDSRLSGDRGGG